MQLVAAAEARLLAFLQFVRTRSPSKPGPVVISQKVFEAIGTAYMKSVKYFLGRNPEAESEIGEYLETIRGVDIQMTHMEILKGVYLVAELIYTKRVDVQVSAALAEMMSRLS